MTVARTDGAEARPASDTTDAGAWADWEAVRREFDHSREWINMSHMFLATHPGQVREAIEKHRRGLDRNPTVYWFDHKDLEQDVLATAATYLGARPDEIALTTSTTMGLGLLFGGLSIPPGGEILATEYDHLAAHLALEYRAQATGATVRRIRLYDDSRTATVDEIVDRFARAVGPQTRLASVTHVHSSDGVKLPIRELAEVVARANAHRDESDRLLLCVDGVHALGVEDVTMGELGCDFFVSGTHKWIFGPRGTGLVWGRPGAWPRATPTIPSFHREAFRSWWRGGAPTGIPGAAGMTPGGYHAYDHRWALAEAFRFHLAIGKPRVEQRVHALARRLKEGIADLPHLILQTPLSDALSAGIVCFEVRGLAPDDAVAALHERRVVATTSPYRTRYVRLSPGLTNSDDEIAATLDALERLAS